MPFYTRSRYGGYSGRSYGHSQAPSASVTEHNGMLLLTSSYSPELVAWLKALPQADRVCNYNEGKTWSVDPKHGSALKKAVHDILGIDVTIPQVAQLSQAERSETFEVRYVGGARQRGDNPERSATGFVQGEWKLIFGELAMRKYFGENDAKPGGIPTKYGVLGVTQDATEDDIRKAYRKMARVTHPDVCKEPDAEDRFKQVQSAYEILSDVSKRQKYNAGLKLQASLGGQRVSTDKVYYSPLRCGIITARVKPVAGNRFVVLEILSWKDILQGNKMLVTTWANGAKTFIEQWVEVVR